MKIVRPLSISLLAVLAMSAGVAAAQPPPAAFVSFDDFVSGVESADASSYLGAAGSKVESAAAFEDMRDHLLSLYEGVEAAHSFLLGTQYVDCIPTLQQPSARALGLTAVATPPAPVVPSSPAPGPVAQSQLTLGLTDGFGNRIACDTGTIPMRRLTLDNLSRFKTLRDFSTKPSPPGRSILPPAISAANYRWEYTKLSVSNLGASAYFNVWYPSVTAGTFDHSLAEMWILAGGMGVQQSAEAGWSVAPDTFGTSAGVLFTYWTADDYNVTGCYDLTCPGFVQTSTLTALGTPFWSGPSEPGNPSYTLLWLSWHFTGGNWWLQVENACAEPPNPSWVFPVLCGWRKGGLCGSPSLG